MTINSINNNKHSFLFKPLKIIKTLGWVAMAILALPTIFGSYFAWKKLADIWSKSERPDTQKTDDVASKALLDENYLEKTPQKEKAEIYSKAIKQFQSEECLSATSAEAYLDHLRNDIKGRGGLDFLFSTALLHNAKAVNLESYLQKITAKVTEAKGQEHPLVFVPFLLEGSKPDIVVAVIDITKERIEYFDPKSNRSYRNLDRCGISTQDFLKKLSNLAFPNKEPDIIRNISGRQSFWHKVDSGAHVLNFIQTRIYTDAIQRDTLGDFNSSLSPDGKQLRKEMAAILQEKLNKEDQINNPVSYFTSLAQRSGLEVSRKINIKYIPEEEDRIAIAKMAAQQSGKDTSLLIKNYKIKNQAALVEIAKIVARQDARGLSQYIQNYGIKDKQALVETAEVAANQLNGGDVSYWIQQYIPKEEDRIAIAKIEAQQKEGSISSFQIKYAIKNQEALTEIAEILNKNQTDI
ncbi:MAG: hypothetical protein ACH349_06670 [Candidatus Rhabdochlamydia sp.]|jgi:hypothetical protein